MINFTSSANDLPLLDFNVDPSVVARTRVALAKNVATLNGLAETRARIESVKTEEDLGIRWFE